MANETFIKRCEECTELKMVNGIAHCEECFGQLCAEIDDCPLGITVEIVEKAQKLTTEQQKVAKKMINSDTHAQKGKIERKKRENPEKEGIISEICAFLAENGYENAEITNPTREIAFFVGEQQYKLTLVATRKPKA